MEAGQDMWHDDAVRVGGALACSATACALVALTVRMIDPSNPASGALAIVGLVALMILVVRDLIPVLGLVRRRPES